MTAVLSVDSLRLLHRYDTARKALAMWTEEKEKVRAELIATLGDEPDGTYDGSLVVSISRSRPKRFDLAGFAQDHPELHRQYLAEPQFDETRIWVPKRLPFLPYSYKKFYDEAQP